MSKPFIRISAIFQVHAPYLQVAPDENGPATADFLPDEQFRSRPQERDVDRKTAEELATRATRIAVAVLGNRTQAIDVVTRAVERVRSEGTQGQTYDVQVLKILVAEMRALAQAEPDQMRTGTNSPVRGADPVLELSRLAISDRVLVALCSVGGLSYSEAARVTGLSKQQVLTSLATARRRLWEAGD